MEVTRKVLAGRKRVLKSCATKRKRKVSLFRPEELYEEILVRLDVEDLIRCKSVCKSWKSLISQRHFIRAHQDYCNNNNGRQTMITQEAVIIPIYAVNHPDQKYYIVGSANGLVCVHTFCDKEFIVANPWTREENMVQLQQPLASDISFRGFGYDSLTDDYKIVFGVQEEGGMKRTSFQLFSLKSNVWKHVGHVNGICRHTEIATLCNGALHWFMHPEGDLGKSSIISFDLSKEVFIEIPQPDDARYGHNKKRISGVRSPMRLGIKDECLCISYCDLDDNSNLWIMRKYNVKESWVKSESNIELKYEVLDLDRIFNPKDEDEVENDVSDIGRSTHDKWFLNKCMCVPAITVMQSLISPHPSRQ